MMSQPPVTLVLPAEYMQQPEVARCLAGILGANNTQQRRQLLNLQGCIQAPTAGSTV